MRRPRISGKIADSLPLVPRVLRITAIQWREQYDTPKPARELEHAAEYIERLAKWYRHHDGTEVQE